MSQNRIITQKDREISKRLKDLYEKARRKDGIVQATLAEKLGITQGAVSQYLNAHVAMNQEIIFKFAEIFKTRPENIDPDLKTVGTLFTLDSVNFVPVFGTLSGKPAKLGATFSTLSPVPRGCYAIFCDIPARDEDGNELYQAGDHLVCDPSAEISRGDLALLNTEHTLRVVQVARLTSSKVTTRSKTVFPVNYIHKVTF